MSGNAPFSLTTMDTMGCTMGTIRNTEFYTEKNRPAFLCVKLCVLRVEKQSNALVAFVKTIVSIVVKSSVPTTCRDRLTIPEQHFPIG